MSPKEKPSETRAKSLRVGIPKHRWSYYSYQYNIIGRVPEVEYLPVEDKFGRAVPWLRRLNWWGHRLTHRQWALHFDLNNQFQERDPNVVDLVHLFNGVSYGKIPWVTTFETLVPRFRSVLTNLGTETPNFSLPQRRRFEKAAQALAAPTCRGVVALSPYAQRVQRQVLQWMPSEVAGQIERKMEVLQPPQPLTVERYEDKPLPENLLRFMFVGHDFFRKGGVEMLESFIALREASPQPFELIIVSALRIDDFATHAGLQELHHAQKLLAAHQDWIKHFPQLPHDEVIAWMKRSHVGLLPTYADSYGYSVLEFMAAGCPVVTTNVQALADINAPDRGWSIPVPRDALGVGTYHTAEGREAMSQAIRNGLASVLEKILTTPDEIARKGQAALTYIQTEHSPTGHTNALRRLYGL